MKAAKMIKKKKTMKGMKSNIIVANLVTMQ